MGSSAEFPPKLPPAVDQSPTQLNKKVDTSRDKVADAGILLRGAELTSPESSASISETHAMSQLSLEGMQGKPLDIQKVVEEVGQALDAIALPERSLVDEEVDVEALSDELLAIIDSALKDVKGEEVGKPVSLSESQIYEPYFNDWLSEIVLQGDLESVEVAVETLTYAECYSGHANDVPYVDALKQLEERGGHTLLSISGVARSEMADNGANTTPVPLSDGTTVNVLNKATVDLHRGIWRVAGESMKEHHIDLPTAIGRMTIAGVRHDEITTVSAIYNQALLSPVSAYLQSRFMNVLAKNQGEWKLDLYDAGVDCPVIKGSMIYKLMDKEDIENQDVRYMKIDILVTNPGSLNPDLHNVHYCLGPLSKEIPQL